MTTAPSNSELIAGEATTWPGVEAVEGARGELSLRLDRRELGHLHGDRVLHIGFPKAVWRELYAQGRIQHHPIFPDREGWAARRIADDADVTDAIALLRINYERAVARRAA